MLNEIRNARQIPGEPRRRWFSDESFDLIVWLGPRDALSGFQLCYDKQGNERALTWSSEGGWSHERVDVGETPGKAKMTPILVPDGVFSAAAVAARFRKEAARIEPAIAEFVHAKLLEYR